MLSLLLGACDSAEQPSAAAQPQPVTTTAESGGHPAQYSAGYAGSSACRDCHQQQFQSWQGSHHDRAMQHANESTVRGDFEDQTLLSNGIETRFQRRHQGYYVTTAGSDAAEDEFQVLYTFGTEPLQQYLVEFPGGRLQALPYAWDTVRKRWFDLQEQLQPQPHEWVHWTRGSMTWNQMCADCHSTGLAKNFAVATDSYDTHWQEINVSCEACHGPGREHITAVNESDPGADSSDPNLFMRGGDSPRELVDQCGYCHSRRQQLSDSPLPARNLLNRAQPALPLPPLYHADGQILDEVFVYGSFLQSRMYHNDVSCNDCHDPHSARLKIDGNALCAQCHDPSVYNTPNHHRHAANTSSTLLAMADSPGNQCVDCHMPGRIYMGVDFRRDHSFRRPRPDLSVRHGTPNACNDCHDDRSAEWAAEQVSGWFGPEREAHFSTRLAAGLLGDADSQSLQHLRNLATDEAQPAIARAAAINAMHGSMSLPHITSATDAWLQDSEPLVRAAAARAMVDLPLPARLSALLPLLSDPVLAVRIAAARSTLDALPASITKNYRAAWHNAQKEFQDDLRLNADFAGTQLEIGFREYRLGNLPAAEAAYRKALQIDSHFNAARLNLAQLYYQTHRPQQALNLYRKVIEQEPDAAVAHFSMGLLQAELGNMGAAAEALQQAAERGRMPRAWYNLAVLHQREGDFSKAEQAYREALRLSPANPEFEAGLRSLQRQQGPN